jgi:hypothetical protein
MASTILYICPSLRYQTDTERLPGYDICLLSCVHVCLQGRRLGVVLVAKRYQVLEENSKPVAWSERCSAITSA